MSSPKPPKPSQQELNTQQAQADMLNYQRKLMEDQQREQELLAPMIYKSANIEPIYGPDGRITGFKDLGPTQEEAAYSELLKSQTRNQKFADALTPLQLRQQGYELQLDAEGNPIGMTLTPGGAAESQGKLLGSQLRTAEQQYEVNQMMLDRTKLALKGELPVDPGIQRQMDENEEQLREGLRRSLGPGYETSTPGIEALSNFNKKREELVSAIQHGEISSADTLAIQGQQVSPSGPSPFGLLGASSSQGQYLNPFAQAGSPNARSAQLLGAVQSPYSGTGGFGSLSELYGQSAAQLATNRRADFKPGGNKAMGALGGAASGASAGAALGPYGAAGGAVVGGLLGYFGT